MSVKDTFRIYESRNSKLIKIKLSRLIGLFSIFCLSFNLLGNLLKEKFL